MTVTFPEITAPDAARCARAPHNEHAAPFDSAEQLRQAECMLPERFSGDALEAFDMVVKPSRRTNVVLRRNRQEGRRDRPGISTRGAAV